MSGDAPARRLGRTPLTDRHKLLAAAEQIGIRHLTLGAVTAKCGVKYTTFYRHWGSRADLVDAVTETVLARATWPPSTMPWRVHLEHLSDAVHDAVTRDPGVGDLIRERPTESWPELLRGACRTAVCVLADAGYHHDDVGVLVAAVVDAAARLHDNRPCAFANMNAVELILDGIAARLPDPDGSAGPDHRPRGDDPDGPGADIVPAVPQQQPAVTR